MTRAFVVLIFLVAPARADRAVTVDGNVLDDGRYDERSHVFVTGRGKMETRHANAQLAVIETDAGAHLFSSDFDARLRAYLVLVRRERRERLIALFDAAYASLDKKLLRELFERAQRDGFGGKEAEKFRKRLLKFEKKVLRTGPRTDKIREVRTAIAKTDSIQAELLIQRIRASLPTDRRGALELLRWMLERTPTHPEAASILQAEAAKDFPLSGRRFWLDWNLDLEPTGAVLTVEKSAVLKRFRGTWRGDIFEVAHGPIHVFTSVKDTAVLGRSLAWGRLTCDALAELFHTDTPRKRVVSGVSVLLYSDKNEYLTTTGTGGAVRDGGFLKWTTGYYTPSDRLSRFYWHKGRDAERRIARTFVHELTHHWIDLMCPRFSDRESKRSGSHPGAWIVEGFATLMEEGRYDLENRTWNLFDARANSLDTVHALSGTGKLIDWGLFYGMSKRNQLMLSTEPGMKVVRRWSMGERPLSLARLYYEQAAATCQFLYHAESGRYRSRLMDFVVNYYTGKKEKLLPAVAFGLTHAELGARVEKFAKDVAEGWRPKSAAASDAESPPK